MLEPFVARWMFAWLGVEMKYDVYMHNLPKVSEDGKESIPVQPNRTQEFADLEEAKKFAAEHKDQFDRVIVMQTEDGKQKLVERYTDGQHIEPTEKEEQGEVATNAD